MMGRRQTKFYFSDYSLIFARDGTAGLQQPARTQISSRNAPINKTTRFSACVLISAVWIGNKQLLTFLRTVGASALLRFYQSSIYEIPNLSLNGFLYFSFQQPVRFMVIDRVGQSLPWILRFDIFLIQFFAKMNIFLVSSV